MDKRHLAESFVKNSKHQDGMTKVTTNEGKGMVKPITQPQQNKPQGQPVGVTPSGKK